MIEEPPVLTLKRKFIRPSSEQIKNFEGIQTGFIVDSMNGRGALDGRIKPLNSDQAIFTGVAITCHAGPADNLAVFGAMELSKPGDVVIAATDQFHHTQNFPNSHPKFPILRNQGGIGQDNPSPTINF